MPKRTCGGFGSKIGASRSKWIKAIKKLASEYRKVKPGTARVISKARRVKKR